MLNEDLFEEKDKEILKLKALIERFKKYDSNRKQYYADVLVELGQLRTYVSELEDTDKKAKKIKTQKLAIKNLERIIAENKIAKIVDPEKIKEIKITELLEHVKKLEQDNKSLREKIGQYRKEISRLCNKLCTNEKTD